MGWRGSQRCCATWHAKRAGNFRDWNWVDGWVYPFTGNSATWISCRRGKLQSSEGFERAFGVRAALENDATQRRWVKRDGSGPREATIDLRYGGHWIGGGIILDGELYPA